SCRWARARARSGRSTTSASSQARRSPPLLTASAAPRAAARAAAGHSPETSQRLAHHRADRKTGIAMNSSTPAPLEPAASGVPWVKIATGIAALVGLMLLGRAAGEYVKTFAEWVDGLGAWGPAVFIVGYALGVAAFLPASLFTLAGGAIFGVGAGTV